MHDMFQRQELLVGKAPMEHFVKSRVIIFGIGGVGSWCAESLVRSGVGHLTIVDFDTISVTNINRQLHATSKTVGQPKVEILAERLRDINPDADIAALHKMYSSLNSSEFNLAGFDYVIDAIDTLDAKIDLIENTVAAGTTLFSSQGAASKIDPTRIKIDSVWNVQRCPLGKLVRKHLRLRKIKADFLCVYSDELIERPPDTPLITDQNGNLKRVNGTFVHITATFGFFLASLVVKDILNRSGALLKERGIDYQNQTNK